MHKRPKKNTNQDFAVGPTSQKQCR